MQTVAFSPYGHCSTIRLEGFTGWHKAVPRSFVDTKAYKPCLKVHFAPRLCFSITCLTLPKLNIFITRLNAQSKLKMSTASKEHGNLALININVTQYFPTVEKGTHHKNKLFLITVLPFARFFWERNRKRYFSWALLVQKWCTTVSYMTFPLNRLILAISISLGGQERYISARILRKQLHKKVLFSNCKYLFYS